MKIYVITAGDYSDYHICAVTDNKESAENLRILYSSYYEATIEEFDTTYLPEKPNEYWAIYINLDGAVQCTVLRHYEKGKEPDKPLNQVELTYYRYSVNVIAKDRDHALKIAFDKIAEYKYEHMEEVEKAEAEKRRWSTYVGNFQMASSAWGME